jgi:hypothetical protein
MANTLFHARHAETTLVLVFKARAPVACDVASMIFDRDRQSMPVSARTDTRNAASGVILDIRQRLLHHMEHR